MHASMKTERLERFVQSERFKHKVNEFRENWVNVPIVSYFYYFGWFRIYVELKTFMYITISSFTLS